MTWWLVLLLCAQFRGQECVAFVLPVPLASLDVCTILAEQWVRLQPQAPKGFVWRLPMNRARTCQPERPAGLPEIPVNMGAERWA